ncbi:hypothetical protein SLOPH_1781 [Spraguea lophii 42_110]|uniref:Uncharacterized protein n=1 Tax=Spraguea lophii (strain 42_110) TaxID=1358809 RepID=S7W502_SPRLO|nr:hypothetical protein SLOPH_1781 [Spraguea lophii 42_110]
MFYTSPPNNTNNYHIKILNNKKYYFLREKKRRYSDQFKDPLFIKKDIFKKLKMIEKLYEENKNMEEEIEKWKECINNCIIMLIDSYDHNGKDIFKALNLKKYGFDIKDYCNESEEEEDNKDD